MKLRTITIILAVLAIGLNIYFFLGSGFMVVLSGFILILIVISLIVLTIIGLVRIVNKSEKKSIAVVLIGIFSLSIVIFVPVGEIIESQKSPIVFKGWCEHTVTSTSLTLREDNSFEFDVGAFLSRELKLGTYSIKNDTIKLVFKEAQTQINTTLYIEKEGVYELGRKPNEWREHFRTDINELK